MGLFGDIAKGVVKVAKTVVKSPLGKSAAALVPGASLAYTAYDIGKEFIPQGGGGGGGALPPVPMGGIPGLPSKFRQQMRQPAAPSTMGERSVFRNDPNTIEALKPYAISMHNLSTYYRAPKGFVVVRDQNGDPMGIPKVMARQMGLWRPSAKPPISATDWRHFKRAAAVSKKLNKIHSQAQKHLTRRSSSKKVPANYTIVSESGPGGVKIGGRKR